MSKTQLHVGIVEDHPVLQEAIREFVERLPRVSGCTVLASAEAAIEEVKRSPPDLMLIDLSLPGMDGIALVRELGRLCPALPCAILSGYRSQDHVGQALAAGAHAYLLKGDPLEIERGIDAMLAGERYLSEGLGQLPGR